MPGSWVVAKRPSVTARKNSSHRGRAVTKKEKGWGERNSSKEESGTGLCGLFKFLSSCEHLVPFWNEHFLAFQTCFCVFCIQFRRSKGGWTAFRMGVCHSVKERFFPLLLRCASAFQATDAPALDTTSQVFFFVD